MCIAVPPALPVERVHSSLGNGLTGGHVWPDVPPSTVVGSPPRSVAVTEREEPHVCDSGMLVCELVCKSVCIRQVR